MDEEIETTRFNDSEGRFCVRNGKLLLGDDGNGIMLSYNKDRKEITITGRYDAGYGELETGVISIYDFFGALNIDLVGSGTLDMKPRHLYQDSGGQTDRAGKENGVKHAIRHD